METPANVKRVGDSPPHTMYMYMYIVTIARVPRLPRVLSQHHKDGALPFTTKAEENRDNRLGHCCNAAFHAHTL